MHRLLRPYPIILFLTALWCLLITATPLAASSQSDLSRVSVVSYKFFSTVCHQIDARSFHLSGYKFPVCIRCTAIYCGFFLGVSVFPFLRRTKLAHGMPLVLIVLASSIMVADVLLAFVHIHESTTFTRILSGGVFGIVISILLVPVIEEFLGQYTIHPLTTSQPYETETR